MPLVERSISSSYYANTKSFEEKSKLDKDDFLKILVTQLQNQDPMQPMQDKEFIAQMAQFSTLEQITNLNKTFSEFKNSQSNLTHYANMIGKEISWVDPQSLATETGTVSAVTSKEGQVYYIIDTRQVRVEDVFYVRSQ